MTASELLQSHLRAARADLLVERGKFEAAIEHVDQMIKNLPQDQPATSPATESTLEPPSPMDANAAHNGPQHDTVDQQPYGFPAPLVGFGMDDAHDQIGAPTRPAPPYGDDRFSKGAA